MARPVKDQECIFCEETPCQCNKKKTRKPRKTKAKTDHEPEPETPAQRFIPQARERDLTMEAAIRACGPILSKSDRLVFKAIFEPHLSDGVERRLEEWKERNGLT